MASKRAGTAKSCPSEPLASRPSQPPCCTEAGPERRANANQRGEEAEQFRKREEMLKEAFHCFECGCELHPTSQSCRIASRIPTTTGKEGTGFSRMKRRLCPFISSLQILATPERKQKSAMPTLNAGLHGSQKTKTSSQMVPSCGGTRRRRGSLHDRRHVPARRRSQPGPCQGCKLPP